MKRGVAPELDRLMWTLAEEANERANQDFLLRHPELSGELTRRSEMVQGLKRLGPTRDANPGSPPPFRPRERSAPTMPRGVMVAVGALVLAALGIASFTASYLLMPRKVEVVRPVQPETAGVGPVDKEVPRVEYDATAIAPEPEEKLPEDTFESSHELLSLDVPGAALSDLVKLIGAQAGKQVILAPGMAEDPVVSAEFQNVTAMQMLDELGEKYGFVPFDQGDGTIILVPQEPGRNEDTKPADRGAERRRIGG